MKPLRSSKLFLPGMIIILAMLACVTTGSPDTASQATMDSMSAQSTALALQITQDAQNLQVSPVTPPDTNPPPPQNPPDTLDELRKSAKILLYEDIATSPTGLERYVKLALDASGYNYMDIKGDQDKLEQQILGNVTWDLIIISSEVSGKIPSDYFEYLTNHLQRETALIIEMWDLDDIIYGKLVSVPKVNWVLDTCGVELQEDWYNPKSRDLWNLQPQHPLFSQPNVIGELKNVGTIWRGDIGDLMQIKRKNNQVIGDASMLIGLTPANTSLNGLLTYCIGGRVVLQTFDTHEYPKDEMINLWQNYVYHTLNNHFLSIVQ